MQDLRVLRRGCESHCRELFIHGLPKGLQVIWNDPNLQRSRRGTPQSVDKVTNLYGLFLGGARSKRQEASGKVEFDLLKLIASRTGRAMAWPTSV
jgi:hypothetical protein